MQRAGGTHGGDRPAERQRGRPGPSDSGPRTAHASSPRSGHRQVPPKPIHRSLVGWHYMALGEVKMPGKHWLFTSRLWGRLVLVRGDRPSRPARERNRWRSTSGAPQNPRSAGYKPYDVERRLHGQVTLGNAVFKKRMGFFCCCFSDFELLRTHNWPGCTDILQRVMT